MRRAALLVAALSVAISAQMPPPDAQQAALGAQMSAEIAKSATLIPDPFVRAYVSELASRLAGRNLLLTLQVMDSDQGRTHEPIWLPGGYMFVSADLIRSARNESEFAGMVAHALAHEIGDDPRRIAEALRPWAIPLYMAGSAADGPAFAPLGYMARARPFELAADASAARMMLAAGYDPVALFDYLSRVGPRDNERVDALTKAIAELAPPRDAVVVDSSDFRNVQERLAKSPHIRPTLYSPRE
jgi:predicted Zn-dependent protease